MYPILFLLHFPTTATPAQKLSPLNNNNFMTNVDKEKGSDFGMSLDKKNNFRITCFTG